MLASVSKFRLSVLVAGALFFLLIVRSQFYDSPSLSVPESFKHVWNNPDTQTAGDSNPFKGIYGTDIDDDVPENGPIIEEDHPTHNDTASDLVPAEEDGSVRQNETVSDIEKPPGDGKDPAEARLTAAGLQASLENMAMEHFNLTSNMTSDGNYFLIDFNGIPSYNPNIIPHPYRDDTYIVVAQRDKSQDDNTFWFVELVCEATFQNSTLKCVTPPLTLAITPSVSQNCKGELTFFHRELGPRDARIFYGPSTPYVIYGARSHYTCFGQHIQDLRRVADWGSHSQEALDPPGQPFLAVTELQRRKPYGEIEKNWFVFWDLEENMYVHYDIKPTRRAFARIEDTFDGSVSEDLAPLAAYSDKPCMAKYLPKLKPTTMEWLHQSTNSLSITLCDRADPQCERNSDNTFIFTIFQHKTFYAHGLYEPYVLLFSASPPFAMHAVSAKPFWVPGRGEPNGTWSSRELAEADPSKDKTWVPRHQSQMIFITSMSWKSRDQTYHGYLDDELFVSFGIEDSASGGIAVKASDLLAGLNFCDKIAAPPSNSTEVLPDNSVKNTTETGDTAGQNIPGFEKRI